MQKIISTRAVQVVRVLSGLDLKTSILVLAEALKVSVEQVNMEVFGSIKIPPARRILRTPQHMFKVERDQDILDFIHAEEEPIMVMDLQRKLVKHFGVSRAPSKSSLYRYFYYLAKQNNSSE